VNHLDFSNNGLCTIVLKGLPSPKEIEGLIEKYVSKVELEAYPLRIMLIDISHMRHMGARSRQVFSELLTQASKHYGGNVKIIVAGGSVNLQRFIELFCKGIGFKEHSHFFRTLDEAREWISHFLKESEPLAEATN